MTKTVTVPVGDFVQDGNLLAEWLGAFWSQIYENKELATHMQYGQGLLAAQLYLDYLESINLLDRRNAPPFHRERWNPITIKLSEANTGNAAMLRIGMDPTPIIGPQTSNSFVQGEVFKIGGHAEYTNAVSYPLDDSISDVLTSVVDNIITPETVLTRGTDFIVREGTIFFLRDKDPFDDSAFPVRTVVDDDGVEDQEILIWATDILIDRDYIYNYVGYILGLKTASNEFYQKLLNGVWDLYNFGTPISYFQSALGAILGEPTILGSSETVDVILTEPDHIQVITDARVYTLSPDATLRTSVITGATLTFGEFLTDTIRLYDTLDPMKLNAVSEFGEQLKTDVYSLFFGSAMLKADVQAGVAATWEVSDIVHAGTDANGNPKLKFTLYGTQDDIDAYWTNFWTYLEDNNLSSETCFEAYLDAIVVPVEGAVYGRVAPLEYFMRYFLRANAMVVVVESSKLTSPPTDRSPVSLLSLVHETLPAHILLYVVEHVRPTPEEYDLTELDTDITQCLSLELASTASPGGPSAATLTYLDRRPKTKWLPVCQGGE